MSFDFRIILFRLSFSHYFKFIIFTTGRVVIETERNKFSTNEMSDSTSQADDVKHKIDCGSGIANGGAEGSGELLLEQSEPSLSPPLPPPLPSSFAEKRSLGFDRSPSAITKKNSGSEVNDSGERSGSGSVDVNRSGVQAEGGGAGKSGRRSAAQKAVADIRLLQMDSSSSDSDSDSDDG